MLYNRPKWDSLRWASVLSSTKSLRTEWPPSRPRNLEFLSSVYSRLCFLRPNFQCCFKASFSAGGNASCCEVQCFKCNFGFLLDRKRSWNNMKEKPGIRLPLGQLSAEWPCVFFHPYVLVALTCFYTHMHIHWPCKEAPMWCVCVLVYTEGKMHGQF